MSAFAMTRKWSFRINTIKTDGSDVLAECHTKGIAITPFAPLPGAYLFDKKDEYALKWSDAFYQGRIYLQSISSLLPVLALAPVSGASVLDVCAAPGSKTTQIAMLMKNEGHVLALEQNPIRYQKLMHNTTLQWATIVEWKRMDAMIYLDPLGITKFDAILVDAPCSAEGRISTLNEKTYGFWSLENIKKKANVQYELVSRAVARLVPDWVLVYSTCTLAPEENEWVISRILSEHPNLSVETIDIGLSDMSWWKEGMMTFGSQTYHEAMKRAVRILPTDDTEGFFMVKMRKN